MIIYLQFDSKNDTTCNMCGAGSTVDDGTTQFWDFCFLVKQLVGSWANVDNCLGSFYGEFPGHLVVFQLVWKHELKQEIHTLLTEIPSELVHAFACLKHVAFQAYWEQRHWLGPLLCRKRCKDIQLAPKKLQGKPSVGSFQVPLHSLRRIGVSKLPSPPLGRHLTPWVVDDVWNLCKLCQETNCGCMSYLWGLVIDFDLGMMHFPGYMNSCSKEHQNP